VVFFLLAGAGWAQSDPVPVIFDTDIGTDIDDTWALALILASPELDLRLVVTDTGDTRERARIAAKYLAAAGRDDVPIGIGVPGEKPIPLPQGPWAEDYDLSAYKGTVHEDGVGAMIEEILASEGDLVLLAVGPVPNLGEALRREPSIANRVRVVAMSGSVDLGYVGSPKPSPEYNVVAAVDAAQALYRADWDLLIAPLDTAGQVQLKGPLYQRLLGSSRPSVVALLDGYRIWAPDFPWARHDPDSESSVLYDALAVALVFDPTLCRLEQVRLEVSEDGFTRRSAAGKPVTAALAWPEGGREAFERFLVDRLLGADESTP
jgi:inosine-uridine nucleoside N-ribohydrolase